MTKPRTPTDHEFEIAIEWLKCNEGDGGEAEACKAAAAWLAHYSTEDMLRRKARAAGVPVGRLRRRLAELARKP